MTQTKAHPPSESSATFIKNTLLKVKKDYPYSLWRKWKVHLEAKGFKAPKYSSFRVFLYACKRAGLVRRTSSPPDVVEYANGLKPFKRSYYELVPGEVDNLEKWRNPQVAVWGVTAGYGRDKYRKKVLGIPPKPVGRPRKERRKYEIK
jgi:hypothetical protein